MEVILSFIVGTKTDLDWWVTLSPCCPVNYKRVRKNAILKNHNRGGG